MIVDCVGLTDEDRAWAETKPLDRKPNVPLKNLLQNIAQGATSDDILSTLGARLLRLNKKLDDDERDELEELAGTTVNELAAALISAADKDSQIEHAATAAGLADDDEPTEEQIAAARERARRRRGRAAAEGRGAPARSRNSDARRAAHRPRPAATSSSSPASATRAQPRRPCAPSSSSSTSTTTSTSRSRRTTTSRTAQRLSLKRHQGAREGDRDAAAAT